MGKLLIQIKRGKTGGGWKVRVGREKIREDRWRIVNITWLLCLPGAAGVPVDVPCSISGLSVKHNSMQSILIYYLNNFYMT